MRVFKICSKKPCLSVINKSYRKRLLWPGHTWRKNDTIIKALFEETNKDKIAMPRLRWVDCVKRDVKAEGLRAN